MDALCQPRDLGGWRQRAGPAGGKRTPGDESSQRRLSGTATADPAAQASSVVRCPAACRVRAARSTVLAGAECGPGGRPEPDDLRAPTSAARAAVRRAESAIRNSAGQRSDPRSATAAGRQSSREIRRSVLEPSLRSGLLEARRTVASGAVVTSGLYAAKFAAWACGAPGWESYESGLRDRRPVAPGPVQRPADGRRPAGRRGWRGRRGRRSARSFNVRAPAAGLRRCWCHMSLGAAV